MVADIVYIHIYIRLIYMKRTENAVYQKLCPEVAHPKSHLRYMFLHLIHLELTILIFAMNAVKTHRIPLTQDYPKTYPL